MAAKQRDAVKSKSNILEAAEGLFAAVGYEAAALEQIGRAAGLSRGAPAYFFGTKRALYEAVLTKLFSDAGALLPSLARRTDGGAESLRGVVVKILRFLHDRPTFLQLIDREVLSGASFMYASRAHVDLVEQAVQALRSGLLGTTPSLNQARHYVLTLLGMCAFPVAHKPLLDQLGFDLHDERFIEERADHIAGVLASILP